MSWHTGEGDMTAAWAAAHGVKRRARQSAGMGRMAGEAAERAAAEQRTVRAVGGAAARRRGEAATAASRDGEGVKNVTAAAVKLMRRKRPAVDIAAEVARTGAIQKLAQVMAAEGVRGEAGAEETQEGIARTLGIRVEGPEKEAMRGMVEAILQGMRSEGAEGTKEGSAQGREDGVGEEEDKVHTCNQSC